MKRKGIIWLLSLQLLVFFSMSEVKAEGEIRISAPSAILMEASTGQIIYEQNASERRSPASITKIMTLLLAFESLEDGKIALTDSVSVSEHAASMGGSQVYLEPGETQTLDTMLKCIAISSANDASVAVAEHIAGTEEAFVAKMNERAGELGMADTHFEDCCGLSDSDNHYTSAKDVAIMARQLITKHPDIYHYTQIWMEDITHQTKRGSSQFTLSSTNKLLKQYEWTTGLKTGSTSKAKYCFCATARKDDVDMIAVVMAAPDPKSRFADARSLLNYGFSISRLYKDPNEEKLEDIPVEHGVQETVPIGYTGEFYYLDLSGGAAAQLEKKLNLPEAAQAPVKKGQQAGCADYYLNGNKVGTVPITYTEDVEKAGYMDYLKKVFGYFLLQEKAG